MATMNLKTPGCVDSGGETLRVGETNRQFTVGTTKHDVTVTIPDSNPVAAVTLWDASTSPITTFAMGVILLDPETERADAQTVDIRITANAQTHILRHTRNVPMLLGASAQGTGAITKIEALNVATTATGAGNVKVRCLLLPAS